jgi:hypothetical protein
VIIYRSMIRARTSNEAPLFRSTTLITDPTSMACAPLRYWRSLYFMPSPNT